MFWRGRSGARVGDHEVTAGPGSYLFAARSYAHTFWNVGPGLACAAEVISQQDLKTTSSNFAEAGDPEPEAGTGDEVRVTYLGLGP